MSKLVKNVIVALKGFAMGAANVIPGVSGGTIALLTGIFSELVESLDAVLSPSAWKLLMKSSLRDFWRLIHGSFLLSLFIGVGVSVFSLAKLMEFALANHPVQTWAFFFGLVAVSSIYLILGIKQLRVKDLLVLAIGVSLGLAICKMSPAQTTDDLWFIAVCGALAICTMILPGISGSFILVILGKYDFVMGAIGDLDWPVLIVFGLGCLLGIVFFSKFLHWLLSRYERRTLLVLIGFTIGSLVKVWPWNDDAVVATSGLHLPGALLWMSVGAALVIILEFLARKSAEPKA